MVNTAKAVSARQRAREASLRFYEREKEREQVQLRYFQAMESVERVYAQRDREIDAVRARAELAAITAVVDADAAIVELLELRVTRSEIQERLACSAGDIRRAESTAAAGEAEAVDEAPAGVDAAAVDSGEAAAEIEPATVDVAATDA